MTNLILAGATPDNVAAHATNMNVLERSALNLLGIFGPAEDLRALVRLPSGKIRQIEPGQRLGLGRVVGIDATGLMVQKNGQTERITMPDG